MNKKPGYGWFLFLFLVVLSVFGNGVAAADTTINEDELFGGTTTVEEPENVVSQTVDQELNRRRVGTSGELNINSGYAHSDPQKSMTGSVLQDDPFQNTLATDLFLDLRFKGGMKGFVSAGMEIYPEGQQTGQGDQEYTDFFLKECFWDANWKGKAYFRLGKQVLKWGRSYYWNPTDLVNIEPKDFFDLNKNREGTTGLKVHIPSGVRRNLYFFVDGEEAKDLADGSLAAKVEWLAGNSEMAVSIWCKDGYHPVFGYDISGRIGNVAWYGEMSLANGKDRGIDPQLKLIPDKEWYPQLSLGFTKSFNYGEISDRISITPEFYYNGAGFTENIYQQLSQETDAVLLAKYLRYYQPFRNSKHYLALFGTFKKLFIPELTLTLNAISNLVDRSWVLSPGLTYKPTLKNYLIDLTVNRYYGAALTEATFLGNEYQFNLSFQFQF